MRDGLFGNFRTTNLAWYEIKLNGGEPQNVSIDINKNYGWAKRDLLELIDHLSDVVDRL